MCDACLNGWREVPLDPCPFCGAEETLNDKAGLIVEYDSVRWPGMKYFVECLACYSDGPGAPSTEEAVELWNTRVTL